MVASATLLGPNPLAKQFWQREQRPFASAPTEGGLLLVEHRDEVYARLAADLAVLGHTVHRAVRTDEVVGMYSRKRAELVWCHADLAGDSGWLAASRLRAIDPAARIWVYLPWQSVYDQNWAKFSGVEEMIYYHGDLLLLSVELRYRLTNFLFSCHLSKRETWSSHFLMGNNVQGTFPHYCAERRQP